MSLSKTSLGMAQLVGQTLATKGIELFPVNGTPVQVLTDLSSNALIVTESANALQGSFDRPDMVALLSEGADASPTPDEVSQHTIQMSESVQNLVRVLQRSLDLTQNVVNPMIDRVYRSTAAYMETKLEATSSPLEIVQKRPDPIFDSIYLQESTSRYVNQLRDVPLRSLNIPVGDLEARLFTGHSGMDAQLRDFLNRMGPEHATRVWDSIFNVAPISSMSVFGQLTDVCSAVFALFFAMRAANEAPAGANIHLSEWKAYCASLTAAAGATIQAYLTHGELMRPSTQLVLSYPPPNCQSGPVYVDGAKYVDWLARGGSPELIFATVYGDRNFDANRMLEAKDKLLSDWGKIMSLYQTQVGFLRCEAMAQGLRAAVTTEINGLDENILPVDKREACHVALRSLVHAVKQRDLDDLWGLCRRTVCRTMFAHTEAETLLDSIDEQAKLHNEKDVRELALYATIDLVARWLCTQLASKAHLPL